MVVALVIGGGTPGDLGGEGGEDWADQVNKYKNDPHAASVWRGLGTILATLIIDNYCSCVTFQVICIYRTKNTAQTHILSDIVNKSFTIESKQ